MHVKCTVSAWIDCIVIRTLSYILPTYVYIYIYIYIYIYKYMCAYNYT